MNFILETASDKDIGNIASLINLAYRGEHGWSKETDIVSGDRVTAHSIDQLLSDPSIHFLVAYSFGHLLCCICLEQSNKVVNIGLFAVNPEYQQLGIGKSALSYAEDYALHRLGLKLSVMQVISQRKELISFYERCGYKKTGLVKPYPLTLNSGTPSVKGLTMDILEKKL